MTGRRKAKKTKGLLISYEGIDGCGKSTQVELSRDYLISLGHKVVTLREPGSTPVAEKIRQILLDKRTLISDTTELLLYQAARAEIVRHEIEPLMASGHIVLCDRFYDSTTAYQGYGRGLDLRTIYKLHRVAVGECRPSLTLLFDVTLKVAASRMKRSLDRLELQPTAFHRRVRKGFLEIAARESSRVKVIDGSRKVAAVFEEVRSYLERRVAKL
jgi:dTMP kinase